jgi:hypothetical protein
MRFYQRPPIKPPRDARPSREQPGTLGQQLEAVALYLANPYRRIDPAAAWELARRLVIPHARAAA